MKEHKIMIAAAMAAIGDIALAENYQPPANDMGPEKTARKHRHSGVAKAKRAARKRKHR